jgi:hypothetical protein
MTANGIGGCALPHPPARCKQKGLKIFAKRYGSSVTRAHRRMTVAAVAAVVVLVASAAQGQQSIEAELPREGAIGDTFTIEGTLPSSCRPGTGEIAFDPDGLNAGGPDPRSGNEVVVARPDAPGAFSESFQVPVLPASDPGTHPLLYVGCLQEAPFDSLIYKANSFVIRQPGEGTPRPGTPAATASRGAPVGAIAGGLAAVLLVGAGLALRAKRRSRARDDGPSDHSACVRRHDAASKGATAAKARLDSAVRTSASELGIALDALGVEIGNARAAFEPLREATLDEQTEVVEGLLDAIVEVRI